MVGKQVIGRWFLASFVSLDLGIRNVNPCVNHSGQLFGSLIMMVYSLAMSECSSSMFLSQKLGILSNPGDVQLFEFFIAMRISSVVISVISWRCWSLYFSSCSLIHSATSLWLSSFSHILDQKSSISTSEGGSFTSICFLPSSL